MNEDYILSNFRTERYARLNQLRWANFLSLGIPLVGKTVFEPGAGIGDQTEWLLRQGVKHIYVNDGRLDNLNIIQKRFGTDPRLTYMLGNLETCLPEFNINVDFIFFYGVYYHLNESATDFHIMRNLSRLGQTVAFDFHAGDNSTENYGGDNPSQALSQRGLRVKVETLTQALKEIWGYAYLPKQQLVWDDPQIPNERRLVAVASHTPLDAPGLNLL